MGPTVTALRQPDDLADVRASYDRVADLARALVPGGQLLLGSHVGEEDVPRTSAYGVDGVRWTTHRWLPEALAVVVVGAGLELVTELCFPARVTQPPQVLLRSRRPAVTGRV